MRKHSDNAGHANAPEGSNGKPAGNVLASSANLDALADALASWSGSMHQPKGPKVERKVVAIVADAKYQVSCTEGATGKRRYSVLGMPVASLLRYMGSQGWTAKHAKLAMASLGLPVSEATIQTQIQDGKSGKCHHGKVPALTAEQAQLVQYLSM